MPNESTIQTLLESILEKAEIASGVGSGWEFKLYKLFSGSERFVVAFGTVGLYSELLERSGLIAEEEISKQGFALAVLGWLTGNSSWFFWAAVALIVVYVVAWVIFRERETARKSAMASALLKNIYGSRLEAERVLDRETDANTIHNMLKSIQSQVGAIESLALNLDIWPEHIDRNEYRVIASQTASSLINRCSGNWN